MHKEVFFSRYMIIFFAVEDAFMGPPNVHELFFSAVVMGIIFFGSSMFTS